MRKIVFDTETTGLSTTSDYPDRIVEIGAIETDDGIPTGKKFYSLINPQRPIPDAVSKIHGIYDKDVAKAPLFKTIAQDFLNFIQDSPLIAHNAKFDIRFINFELSLIGKPPLCNEAIDTLPLARKMFPGAQANLDALCRRFNISLEKRKQNGHGALLDSELLAEVYIQLIGGKQSSFDLTTKTKNITLKTQKREIQKTPPFPIFANFKKDYEKKYKS